VVIGHDEWRGMRVGIVGAAREGLALVRYLGACGAEVVLADNKPAEALTGALQEIMGLDIGLALGGAPLEVSSLDILFVSPGVPSEAPIVEQARRVGVPISSEPRLLTQSVACPVAGITGTSGKTTTTTLVGRKCEAAGLATWVGGNIGEPLTPRLLFAETPEVVVMELSSFQLELFAPEYQGSETERRRSEASRVINLGGWSPHVAVVTNVTPNHLDRHATMEAYRWAKERILAYQTADDWAVLNADDPVLCAMGQRAPGRRLAFSLEAPVQEGAYLQDDSLVLRFDGRETSLCQIDQLRLRGRHNVANVLAAAACAGALGLSVEAMAQVARTFAGVPHRLEHVRTWRGALFVNDSIATSPERSMAAMRAYTEPLVLLAGGRDKHLPWDAWAATACERARLVISFGEVTPLIGRALDEAGADVAAAPELLEVVTLEEAVAQAARLAQPGDVVLLSPGGTSFDAFVDFEARGERFRELVTRL